MWLPDGAGLVTSVRSTNIGVRNFIIPLPNGPERELAGVKGTPCSFSRDGQWLYFSLITKDVDIYRYSMKTGEVRQVTVDARASHATQSPDGKFVYFSKPESELGLWRIPADGGTPRQVLPNLARRTLFHVFDQGIFYVARESRASVLKLRRFEKEGDVDLYRTTTPSGWPEFFSFCDVSCTVRKM